MDTNQTTIFTAIIIAVIILAIIIIYFFVTLIRHHRRNIELYKSKILAEITTQENERKRIAADLHDELGPILSAVKFKVNSLDLQNGDDEKMLETVNNNIDNIIWRMREISNDLMPTTLLRKGLVPAIEQSISNLNRSNNLDVRFNHTNIPEIKAERSINLYRILQEIIHNTIKHAGATELKIEMRLDNNTLLILTKDNGKGFDHIKQSKENTGLGLRNLLSRTEVLGGDMFIESKPGKGTEYTFEIPL